MEKISRVEMFPNLVASKEPATVYDVACKSIPELVYLIMQRLNETIEHMNNNDATLQDHLDYVLQQLEEFYLKFDENLRQEIQIVLQAWIEDGTLEQVISQLVENRAVYPSIQALQQAPNIFQLGAIVELQGYHYAGDGAGHKRIIADVDDGSGVAVGNKFANLLHDGTVFAEWFGGNLQKALDYQATKTLELQANKTYTINTAIKIPREKSVIGNGATIKAHLANWTNHTFGASVPSDTVVYVEARLPINQSEILQKSVKIADFKIESDTEQTFTAMYFGWNDRSTITQATSVNYSVSGYIIENITAVKAKQAFHVAEVWDTNFNDLNTSYCKNGILIEGQAVNNTFNQCKMYTTSAGEGSRALKVVSYIYPQGNKRPEGISFNGGFYGSSEVGIEIVSALAFYFTNCIIDLNSKHAVVGTDLTQCSFNSCYMYNDDESLPVLKINPISVHTNNTDIRVRDCQILNSGGKNAIEIGNQQNGIVLDSNTITGSVNIGDCRSIKFTNNNFTKDTFTLTTQEQSNVVVYGNVNKQTGAAITTALGNKTYFHQVETSTKFMNDVVVGGTLKLGDGNITPAQNILDPSLIDNNLNSTKFPVGISYVACPNGVIANSQAGNSVVMHIQFDVNLKWQVSLIGNNIYMRSCSGETWSEWKMIG